MKKEASHTKPASTTTLRLVPEIGLVDLADTSLTERLADLLKRPVELVPEHELSRHLREHVLEEAVDL